MNQCLYCRWVFYYVFYRTNKKRTSRQIHADNVVRSDFCRQSCVMTRLYRWLKCLKHIIVFVLSMLSKVEHEIKSAHIICKQKLKLLHTKFIFHKRFLLVNSAKSRSKVADISSDKRSSRVKPHTENHADRQTELHSEALLLPLHEETQRSRGNGEWGLETDICWPQNSCVISLSQTSDTDHSPGY